MSKSKRRQESFAAKRIRKEASMSKPGQKSRYAIKRQQQMRGNYRPTSPFYLSASERARLEHLAEQHPAAAVSHV